MKKFLLTLLCAAASVFSYAETMAFQATGATNGNTSTATTIYTLPTGNVHSTDYTQLGVCTFHITKSADLNSQVNSGWVRWYSGDNITLTPASGITINSVTIHCGDKKFGTITIGSNSIQVTSSSPNATFTKLNSTSAITISNSAQIRFSYLEIDYTKDGGSVTPDPVDPVDYTPNFTNLSLKVGETSQLELGEKHPTEIIFSSNDENVVTVSDEGLITAVAEGSTTINVSWDADDNFTANSNGVEFTVTVEEVVEVESFNQELNSGAGCFNVSGSGYVDKSIEIGGINYAANMAGDKSSIQLRSKNSTSGIVVTANKEGYVLRKIEVEWNASTMNGRVLNVYGKDTAYSAPSDLYNDSKQGTLIGSITNGTSTTLEIKGDYAFIGLRSKSDAMYISKITLTWEKSTSTIVKEDCQLSFIESLINYDINDEFTSQELTNPQNLTVTWSSSNKTVATIDAVTGAISVQGLGTTEISAVFGGNNEVLSGSATYTLIVSDRNLSTVTFDFINEEYGMTRHTSGSDYNPDPTIFSNGWIGAVANGQTRLWSNKGMRTYSGSSIVFFAPAKCSITKVSVLNDDNAVNNSRTEEFSIDGAKATYTHQLTGNADLAKIVISYKGSTEEEIAAEFEAATNLTMTINGNTHTDESFTKTAEADAVVSLSHIYPHAKIFHKWEVAGTSQEGIDAQAEDGFVEHTEPLSLDRAGQLSYYAIANGHQTITKTLTVNGPTTGISEVEAGVSGEAEWFDLQGRRVSAPAKGNIYILKEGSKVSKRAF